MLLRLAALVLSFLFPGSLRAAPSCVELRAKWENKYLRDFSLDQSQKIFTCPGGESSLALAFHDLETAGFTADKEGYRPDFYGLVRDTVKAMNYDAACTHLAYAFEPEKKITICPAYFEDTREGRASTLIHETRHLDPDDPSHVACTGGQYKGNADACDDTFYDGAWLGSGFNADIYFLVWMNLDTSKSELSHEVMQSEINALVPDRFNHVTAQQIRKWRGN